ncbi:alanine aminotransferase 2-like isoform X1 [Hypomesus transpacificus]|uniref:alanine aminotransferase 2-like isoform X1 n=1 Tax=Hypomesus transpacificus TaxID=137520 RepID=UPI001F07977B|nr:alanine aminotransferase 2-like isoform X1 [Hypomesus transpacificus]
MLVSEPSIRMSFVQDVKSRMGEPRVSPQESLQKWATLKVERKPFQKVIDVSSDDSHRAGMKPFSFVRQVLAGCLYPELLYGDSLPQDARKRVQDLLRGCDGGSVGSYSDSAGLLHVQSSVAEFITRRDAGVPSHSQNIFISAGSQQALTVVLKLLARGEGLSQTGVLAPQPWPRTLPMVLDVAGVCLVPYPLHEEQGWALEVDQLHWALQHARGRCHPRAIYISNPGNPTGHVQSRQSIEEVIQFAAEEKLFLLVDEVYQDSVYGKGRDFVSYKRVLFEMGRQYSKTVQMASFHSLSKSVLGECGLRAGYMELVNVDPDVMLFAETLFCCDICAPVPGQLALEVMVRPPEPGEVSYGTYKQEVLSNRNTLAQNAQQAWECLIGLPGVSCQPVMGGVSLYPKLSPPPALMAQAMALQVEVDVLYSHLLLEEEGVCVGAGSEHGQREGSYHLRLCILTRPDTLEEVLSRLTSFHLRLLDQVSQHALG